MIGRPRPARPRPSAAAPAARGSWPAARPRSGRSSRARRRPRRRAAAGTWWGSAARSRSRRRRARSRTRTPARPPTRPDPCASAGRALRVASHQEVDHRGQWSTRADRRGRDRRASGGYQRLRSALPRPRATSRRPPQHAAPLPGRPAGAAPPMRLHEQKAMRWPLRHERDLQHLGKYLGVLSDNQIHVSHVPRVRVRVAERAGKVAAAAAASASVCAGGPALALPVPFPLSTTGRPPTQALATHE